MADPAVITRSHVTLLSVTALFNSDCEGSVHAETCKTLIVSMVVHAVFFP